MLETIREAAGRAAERATDRAPASLEGRIERVCSPLVDETRARRADRAFAERSLPTAEVAPGAPRHVVVLAVDCLRADAVRPGTAPFLASLDWAGGDAGAVAPSTWTFPSVTSLLTGAYPHVHGATRRSDDDANSVADMTPLPPRLDAGTATLPERFAGAGYDTYGSFGMLVPFLALRGRFERHALSADADADAVLSDHLRWLLDRRAGTTFSYLHLSDLHEPVDPPAAYWREHGVDRTLDGIRSWRHEDVTEETPTVDRYRAQRRRLYRAAVEYVDNRIAAYRRRLRDLLGDDAVLFVVGDHGEAFWERAAFDAETFADPRPAYCVGHGGAPYESVARVPLLADGLDLASGPASLVDLAPTAAAEAGLDLPDADGVPLTDPRAADRRLLVEGTRYGYEKKAVYGDGRKLVVSKGDGVAVGLSAPGDEPVDLSDAERERLFEAMPAWPDGRRPRAAVSGGVKRRLERLGYA